MSPTNKIQTVLSRFKDESISDLHISESSVYVRKSNGELTLIEDVSLTKEDVLGFIYSVVGRDKLELLNKSKEVDGAFSFEGNRYRINIFEDMYGHRLAIRKIMRTIPTLEEIGIPEHIKKSFMKDSGLILVTGPTGSGKSTTIASIVEYINSKKDCHILTLEDPIEYVFHSNKALVTQREIGRNSSDWITALKMAMRQDPDIIVVGEMRDIESIEAVLTIVETGHLVISSLHTSDAAQTISRIIDVFPPNKREQISLQLSMSLECVIAQKLLPTADNVRRTVAREIMLNIPAISTNIRENKVHLIPAIIETGGKYGMQSMDLSLAYLLAKNYITLETAMPKIKNPETFKLYVEAIKDGKRLFKPTE